MQKIKKLLQTMKPSLHDDRSLLVGAAIGTREEDKQRIAELAEVGVNAVILDSSQGDSVYQVEMLKHIKKSHPGLPYTAMQLKESIQYNSSTACLQWLPCWPK